jgi:alanine racemase
MARVGVPESEWADRLAGLADARGLDVEGLQTHLARAEELDVPTTAEQLERFARGLALAREAGIDPPLVHVANTAGALAHPGARATMVRAGIGIYGVSPGPAVRAADHGLRPAARLVSAVSYVKRITEGTPVSYGHRWAAPRDGWLATVPIGYADGLPRAVRGRAHVLHRGRRRDLVGSITMDQVLVWCDEDEPSVGDEVVLFGRAREGDEHLRVEEVAGWAETIAYEVLTGIGPRVPRVSVATDGAPS